MEQDFHWEKTSTGKGLPLEKDFHWKRTSTRKELPIATVSAVSSSLQDQYRRIITCIYEAPLSKDQAPIDSAEQFPAKDLLTVATQ